MQYDIGQAYQDDAESLNQTGFHPKELIFTPCAPDINAMDPIGTMAANKYAATIANLLKRQQAIKAKLLHLQNASHTTVLNPYAANLDFFKLWEIKRLQKLLLIIKKQLARHKNKCWYENWRQGNKNKLRY